MKFFLKVTYPASLSSLVESCLMVIVPGQLPSIVTFGNSIHEGVTTIHPKLLVELSSTIFTLPKTNSSSPLKNGAGSQKVKDPTFSCTSAAQAMTWSAGLHGWSVKFGVLVFFKGTVIHRKCCDLGTFFLEENR